MSKNNLHDDSVINDSASIKVQTVEGNRVKLVSCSSEEYVNLELSIKNKKNARSNHVILTTSICPGCVRDLSVLDVALKFEEY